MNKNLLIPLIIIIIGVIGFCYNSRANKNVKSFYNVEKDIQFEYSRDGMREVRNLEEILRGRLHGTSVFSPQNPNWFFDIECEDENGQTIKSSSWNTQEILQKILEKNKDKKIKRINITVATNTKSWVPANVFDGLKYTPKR